MKLVKLIMALAMAMSFNAMADDHTKPQTETNAKTEGNAATDSAVDKAEGKGTSVAKAAKKGKNQNRKKGLTTEQPPTTTGVGSEPPAQ